MNVVRKVLSSFLPETVPLYISVPTVRYPSSALREYSSEEVIFPSLLALRAATILSRLNMHTTISAASPAATSPNMTMLKTYMNPDITSGKPSSEKSAPPAVFALR